MTTTEERRPQGVVGVISPWDYPLTLAMSDLLPALVAGNAVVLKPDTQSVLTALWAVDLLHRAGLPESLVQVVVGEGGVIGTALVDAVDHLCFTGSTRTGRVVAAQAGSRLVGASLELGGKNPFYVAADEHGARVLAGGRPRPDVGPLFHEPTVLADVPQSAACFGEETFGPVVSVHVVGSDDEAVALANDTDFGLNANVWTRDTARGPRLAARIRAGTVSVNETYIATWGAVAAPMGGMKASGLGRRHGREGISRFTQAQTITVQHGTGHGVGLGRVVDLPAATWTRGFTLALRAMRASGRS